MKMLLMAALVPAFLLGCSDHNASSSNPNPVLKPAATNSISVATNDGQPVVGAQVMIGDAVNSPFQGNVLTTDQTGQIALPAGWTAPASVTVSAAGFVRLTYLNQAPGALAIKLRRQNQVNQYELKGASTGLPIQDGDGNIDFGLVMPAFAKMDLLTFNMDSIISQQTDTITIIGQDLKLPSNISLPKQSEHYAFFNITLNKPQYRIYFGQPGKARVYAARGRFPFKPVVDAIRGGSEFYELINQFKITGGVIRDFTVVGNGATMDLPMTEMNYTDSKTVLAPSISGDETFMAIGIANQSGYMIPTDVKNVAANQSGTLATLAGADQLALGVLKKSDDLKNGGDRLSATLVPFNGQTALHVLPLIANPTVNGDGTLAFPQFNSIDGVNPIATYSVLSSELQVQQGNSKVTVMNPQWEIYSQNWVTGLKLPQVPATFDGTLDIAAAAKQRWEVNFLGSQTASQAPMGPAMIDSATHVTHSSVTF